MKILKKKEDRYEEYPKVVYENRKVKKYVLAYLKYLGCPSFRIILKDMGFTKEDTVYLYKDTKDMEFFYSVNDRKINYDNQMRFSCGFLFESLPYILIKNVNEEVRYECMRNNPEKDGIWFDKTEYRKKISSDIQYIRCYSTYGFYNSLIKDNYKLNISMYDGIDIWIDEDIKKIEKEEELEKYLISLVFPIKIDEVYRRICEIIGRDIDKYDRFKLEVSKFNDSLLRKYNVTDIIELDKGELVKFGMTMGDKSIFVDGDNNWSYKMMNAENKSVCYSLTLSDDGLNYSVKESNDTTKKDWHMIFFQNLEEVKDEVEKVKTRVRSLLKK